MYPMARFLACFSLVICSVSMFAGEGFSERNKANRCLIPGTIELDAACVLKNIKAFERLVYNTGYSYKAIYAQALYEAYQASGNTTQAALLYPRIAIYVTAESIYRQAVLDACNCDPSTTDTLTLGANSFGYDKEADYLGLQGPEHAEEVKMLRKSAKRYRHGYQQSALASAAGVVAQGAVDYAQMKGGTYNQQVASAQPSSGVDTGSSVNTVPGLPQCTRTRYTANDASLYIENSCTAAVTVAFTSDSGNTWGTLDVGPNGSTEATAFGIGYDPRKDGGIYLFTCPKGSIPVMPNGSAWMSHSYQGQYGCHS